MIITNVPLSIKRAGAQRLHLASICAVVSYFVRLTWAVECPAQWSSYDAHPNATVFSIFPWDPDAAGPEPELLLVGGAFTEIDGLPVNFVAAWDGKTWRDMGSENFVNLSLIVTDFAEHNGVLYCTAGGLHHWDGVDWVYEPAAPFPCEVLLVHDGDLIVGGAFPGGVERWDGSEWHTYGAGVSEGASGDDPYVGSLAVYNGELYIAGNFQEADGKGTGPVARWDGTTWNRLNGNTEVSAQALEVYDGELYVGGTNARLSRWDGTLWTEFDELDAAVNELMEFDRHLIVIGNFNSPTNGIARWNGASFESLGAGIDGVGLIELGTFGDDLIVGGRFTTVNGLPITNLAMWGPRLAGDLTGDKLIDLSDLNLVLIPFLTCPGDAAYDELAGTLADDGNDCVNLGDLGVVLANWGKTCE